MSAKSWFELAVRVIGVVMVIYGAQYLLDSLLFSLGYFNYPESTPNYYVIAGLFHVFVGLYMIRGAPSLVRFAAPMEEENEESEDEEDDQQDA